MNKYWINKTTGQKIEVINQYSSPALENPYVTTAKKEGYKTLPPLSNFILERDYIPITEAEYNSTLTLKEIQKGGINLEVGGSHYQQPIQVWDFVYANHIPFDEACCIKYLCRHKQKGGAEDIRKVISYCKHILKTQYNEE